jgi:hypothetical protein
VERKTGDHYLVDATDFLLRDAYAGFEPLRSNQQGIMHWIKTGQLFIYPGQKIFA